MDSPVSEWVDAYNAEHAHSALDGATPNDVWCSQTNELRFPDDEAIRLAMLSTGRTYRVQQAGVHFQNRYYTSPDLARQHLIHRDVEVRYMPRDPSFIEVFVDGKWRATAFPHQSLTDAQKDELKRIVRDQYRTARNYHKEGARRRAIAAQTAPGDLAQMAADPDTLGPDDDAFLDLADAASISQVDQAPAPDPLDVEQNDTEIEGDGS